MTSRKTNFCLCLSNVPPPSTQPCNSALKWFWFNWYKRRNPTSRFFFLILSTEMVSVLPKIIPNSDGIAVTFKRWSRSIRQCFSRPNWWVGADRDWSYPAWNCLCSLKQLSENCDSSLCKLFDCFTPSGMRSLIIRCAVYWRNSLSGVSASHAKSLPLSPFYERNLGVYLISPCSSNQN